MERCHAHMTRGADVLLEPQPEAPPQSLPLLSERWLITLEWEPSNWCSAGGAAAANSEPQRQVSLALVLEPHQCSHMYLFNSLTIGLGQVAAVCNNRNDAVSV